MFYTVNFAALRVLQLEIGCLLVYTRFVVDIVQGIWTCSVCQTSRKVFHRAGNVRKRWSRWRQGIHNHLIVLQFFRVRGYQSLQDTPVTLFYFIYLQWPVSNVTYEYTCTLIYIDCHQSGCWNRSSHCCFFANTCRNSVCVFRGLWVSWPGGGHAEGWPLFPSCWLPLQAALCTFNTFYVVISHTRPAALFRNAGDMFYDFRWNCWLCRERMTQVPLHLDLRNS